MRKNANFHALYFAICHGREAGKTAVHDLAGVAQSHGYRVALAQAQLVPLKRAEDVLTTAGDPSERTPAEARRDVHPERSPTDGAPPTERPLRFDRRSGSSVPLRHVGINVWTVRKERLRGMSPATVHLLRHVAMSASTGHRTTHVAMSAGSVHPRRRWAESAWPTGSR